MNSRPRRIFSAVVLASSWLASAGIFALMLLVVADVSLRFLFNSPIVGVNEVMEMSIVAMLYMQVAQALRDGRLTRSDTFFNRLMARDPRRGHLLGASFNAAGALLMVIFIWAALPRLLRAYNGGFYVGNAGAFTFPEWPLRLVIVLGCALIAIQFALLAADNLRARAGGLHARSQS